ncbi:hypothetical protein LZV44_04105 [Klebsiella variicola]|uniref:hypothetical protein n=1 Tax=Klebsiella pneumoniae complex TaxID=3390273 RepID=UPI000AD7450D|nr:MULTISPECIES: hypothetical protein [Klebsiella]MCE7538708.1 hypothetical protein [Klebsiella variicola]MDE1571793.1 hypothetical protein [Klebsiella pneumoniae]
MIRTNRFLRGIGSITLGIIAVLTVISLLSLITTASIRIILPPPICCSDKGIINTIAIWGYGGLSKKADDRTDSEFGVALRDDNAVERWVARCTSILLSDAQPYSNIKAKLEDAGGFSKQYADNPSNNLVQDSILPIASDLISLSKGIFSARIENATNATEAYVRLQVSIWSTVLLGFATTVLVSLSSTEFGQEKSVLGRVIRVLAIILPALGTAVAAISAFYAPREDLARSSQALASLRQIHSQIASEIGPTPCPNAIDAAQNKGEIAVKLVSWKKMLRDARTLAEAAALAAVDPTRNQAPTIQGTQDSQTEVRTLSTESKTR